MKEQSGDIVLSVMVITHNQADLFEQCMRSLLRQKISRPWEIVVSDDNSTDDTWDRILAYVRQYPESLSDGKYFTPAVTCSQINSDDYSPLLTSDRCAANKANVYSHARGKYCVNIDADDYLKGDDIYEYQINQLESHPECAVAVQNIVFVDEGRTEERLWFQQNIWAENQILSLDEYCRRQLFISNQAFMMRRDPSLIPIVKYGVLFDDPIISMHHLLKGKIICSQKAQYMHVQYGTSIWNELVGSDRETIRLLTPLIAYMTCFPDSAHLMLQLELRAWISNLKKYLSSSQPMNIDEGTRKYVYRFNNRLLKAIVDKPHAMRAKVALYICLMVSKYKIRNPKVLTLLASYFTR